MLFKELLLEAREPDLKYAEKRIKNALDRVTVELEGNQSGAMSRLTLRYHRLDKAAKLMAEKRNELNAQMKAVAESLFDAEDAVLTRVVETISCTIMLTKAERAADKEPTLKTDYGSVVAELLRMVPELTDKIKDITAKYTEVVEAKDTPTQLRVKSKVAEGLMDTVKSWMKSFIAGIKSWCVDYDKRLAALKKELSPIAEALTESQLIRVYNSRDMDVADSQNARAEDILDVGRTMSIRDKNGLYYTTQVTLKHGTGYAWPEVLRKCGINPKTELKNKLVEHLQIPTLVAWGAKDRNRLVEPNSTNLSELMADIKRNGIKMPITITVSVKDQAGYVTDGNNRLAAAKELGIKDIPYVVEISEVPFMRHELQKAKSIKELGIPATALPAR